MILIDTYLMTSVSVNQDFMRLEAEMQLDVCSVKKGALAVRSVLTMYLCVINVLIEQQIILMDHAHVQPAQQ